MTGPRSALTCAKAVGHVAETFQPKAAPQHVAIDPETRAVIDDLFARLKGIYPAWKQAWPTEAELSAAKREWLAEFMRSGIRSLDQIQHGLRLARQSNAAFAPSPGQFITWCFSPEPMGMPSYEAAYREALRNTHPAKAGWGRWSHPAVYHAAVAVGFTVMQRTERALSFKAFEKKYLEQCRKVGRGEEIAPAPVAVLAAPKGERTPEVANAFLAALRKRLGDSSE